MKVSVNIAPIANFVGDEKAVEYVAEAGFDAWDFSMFSMCRYDWSKHTVVPTDHPLSGNNYLKFARELKKIGLDNGIVCNQSHAPFPSTPIGNDWLKRAIECTAEAGGGICVIHPDNNKIPEGNAEMYSELLPFAKQCGVKIATENMWNWDNEKNCSSFAACATSESFVEHIDYINDPDFVACLDIGHAEMQGSGSGAVNMIKALGPRIKALHIHDNDRLNDSHQIPFSMNIDFEAVAKALAEIGYDGYFTLETDGYLKGFNAENVFGGVKDLYAAVKKLADMFESFK